MSLFLMTLCRSLLKWTVNCGHIFYSILCVFIPFYTCGNLQEVVMWGDIYEVCFQSIPPTLFYLLLEYLWASQSWTNSRCSPMGFFASCGSLSSGQMMHTSKLTLACCACKVFWKSCVCLGLLPELYTHTSQTDQWLGNTPFCLSLGWFGGCLLWETQQWI